MLFNNAGMFAPAVPFEELTYDQWKAVVDVNLNGAFLCAQAAFRIMKDQEAEGPAGSSTTGRYRRPCPGLTRAPYTAPEHAMSFPNQVHRAGRARP